MLRPLQVQGSRGGARTAPGGPPAQTPESGQRAGCEPTLRSEGPTDFHDSNLTKARTSNLSLEQSSRTSKGRR